jgi:hypothetical protein
VLCRADGRPPPRTLASTELQPAGLPGGVALGGHRQRTHGLVRVPPHRWSSCASICVPQLRPKCPLNAVLRSRAVVYPFDMLLCARCAFHRKDTCKWACRYLSSRTETSSRAPASNSKPTPSTACTRITTATTSRTIEVELLPMLLLRLFIKPRGMETHMPITALGGNAALLSTKQAEAR